MHYLNMALIDKASLLMVPSTYEEGTLYNVLPSGNRAPDNKGGAGYDQTRADFTFDRGTDHGATRIGSDGLIKKYRENLLLQSNQFDTTWSLSLATLTSGQEGYDGTNNAWLLEATGTNARINQSESLDVCNVSVYAKAGSVNFIRLSTAVANMNAYFDLANGTIGTLESGVIDATIESVGNDWHRCSMTVSSCSQVRILVAQADGDSSGTSGSIYIQNAQLESSMVATDYLDSGATTAKAGVLIDLPRINYDANGENGALLLEPSRQQLFQYSEYFGGWTAAGCSISANYAISPEGIKNAYLLTYASGGSRIYDFNNITGTSLAISVFVKGVSGNGCHLLAYNLTSSSVQGDMTFSGNTFTKASGSYSAKSESVGDGWYRVSIVVSGFTSGDNIGVYLYTDNNSGTTSGSSLLAYGFQAEPNASYVSSYIPNHGESGGVTRAADVCNGGGSAESINSTEGVLYAEISALVNGGENRVMTISDGSYDNSVRIQLYTNTNEIEMRIVTGNAVQALQRVAITNTLNFNKIAVKYKANDFQLWVNGSKLRFDTSGTLPSANTFDTLNFDDGDGNGDFYGNVKQVAVFNEALSDSELATLTTL